jgi:predicted O-linked N-acetylglucosamine transferase (SPINDLY family)
LRPTLADAWFSRGLALSLQARFADAAASLRRALELDPHHPYALGASLHAQLQVCDWRGYAAAAHTLEASVERDEPVDFPFSFLAICDSPTLQLKCSRRFAALQGATQGAAQGSGPAAQSANERIRIAYVSADFLEHPTAYLMAGLFEKHDRRRFEIIGVSLRDDAQSPTARRIMSAFDQVVAADALPDAVLARRMRDMRIDIAVDLMGYTGEHRSGVFTHRPAPIQVNYLGFPATTGSPHIDYLIGDEFLIPPAHRTAYSECIAYLPDAPPQHRPPQRRRAP